jgi:hypothetical protein
MEKHTHHSNLYRSHVWEGECDCKNTIIIAANQESGRCSKKIIFHKLSSNLYSVEFSRFMEEVSQTPLLIIPQWHQTYGGRAELTYKWYSQKNKGKKQSD